MPSPHLLAAVRPAAAPAPSTPLGPFEDSVVSWTTWTTLMAFVGLTAFALTAAGPVARRLGPDVLTGVTTRLARAAVVMGVLAIPAVLTDLAHGAAKRQGYDYGAAWNSLYDGSNAGRLAGLEVTLALAGTALVAPLTLRRFAEGPARLRLLIPGLGAGTISLGATRFPSKVPVNWGRTSFETLMWMLHLIGGAVWIGGLIGLVLLGLPGTVRADDRGAFWAPVIRRFSLAAMGCVAAVALSGLFLYWEHVDGLDQLLTTMYGRVLGVKILLFGGLLLLGVFNQFWLHPRVEALRAAGDTRRLGTILVRRFPVAVATEVLLGLLILLVAPFLHGSARNQAFQAETAKHSAVAVKTLPRLPAKEVSTSTWVWGTAETAAVVTVMIAGYRVSGRMARRRIDRNPTSNPATASPAIAGAGDAEA